MKKLTFFATMTIVALVFASCNKNDYSKFVGTWGVEKIEYYNIDYAGNPITSSIETHTYNPQDTDNGIHLVFKADKTGEMRDSAIDTVLTDWNDVTETFDSYIVNPDTVLVYPFTYYYDKFESVLFLTIKYSYPYEYMRTYQMKVSNLTNSTFIYENEYDIHYMERAYLKRINDTPSKSASRQTVKHPHKPGSLLGDR